jgi:hypothetical protein
VEWFKTAVTANSLSQKMKFSLLPLLGAVFSQIELPVTSTCGLPPNVECLVQNAQYTVVGTIRETFLNQPNASPSRFNVTMNIRCMWGSFSSPISPGDGLVGRDLLVTNFGTHAGRCPTGSGALAAVNDTKIYYIYVARRAPLGGSNDQAIFGIQNICVGGSDLSNKNVIERVLAASPDNKISARNMGTDPFCALAIPTPTTGGSSSPSGTNAGPPQFSSKAIKETIGAFAAFIVAGIALSL